MSPAPRSREMAAIGRATRSLRRPRRRAVVMLVVGVLMFLGAGLVIGPADDRQERLEAHGARVEGIVIKADAPFRGPRSVCFRYVFEGREYVVSIFGSGGYDVGEGVTVYVDPEHPATATLPGEQPQSKPTYFLTLILVVSSLWLIVAGVVGLLKTLRRAREATC